MGTTVDKIEYSLNAKDDITAAITEQGVEVPEEAPLGQYGDLIRAIRTGGGQSDWAETDEESDAYIKNKPTDLYHITDNTTIIPDVSIVDMGGGYPLNQIYLGTQTLISSYENYGAYSTPQIVTGSSGYGILPNFISADSIPEGWDVKYRLGTYYSTAGGGGLITQVLLGKIPLLTNLSTWNNPSETYRAFAFSRFFTKDELILENDLWNYGWYGLALKITTSGSNTYNRLYEVGIHQYLVRKESN